MNFSKNNWHYINHMPVLNQEILINPELSHACGSVPEDTSILSQSLRKISLGLRGDLIVVMVSFDNRTFKYC